MHNPRILETLKMFEAMTNKHSEDLFRSSIVWDCFRDPDEYIVQVAGRLVLEFKH